MKCNNQPAASQSATSVVAAWALATATEKQTTFDNNQLGGDDSKQRCRQCQVGLLQLTTG